ncbi:MAG: hypothetical protein JJU33_09840 [Phycisphaerales bacterium]|nr:hypothetical protein [Phycisphaerales bacterium]
MPRKVTRSGLPHRLGRLCALAAAGSMLIAGTGCQIFGVAGVVAKAIDDATPKKVYAEYTGLQGKTFAVVVAASQMVQSEFPALVPELTSRVTANLAENAGAAGFVPAEQVVLFQKQNPRWALMDREELGKALGGVDRVVFIELDEFRLREPGNRYLWDGQASGMIAVIEADGPLAGEYRYQRMIRVGFPDSSGFSQDDFGAGAVASALVSRFSRRAAWMFYDHEEAKDLTF